QSLRHKVRRLLDGNGAGVFRSFAWCGGAAFAYDILHLTSPLWKVRRASPPFQIVAKKAKENVMYKTILVPLDGSTFAEHALPLALSLARRSHAELHLVTISTPLTQAYIEGVFVGPPDLEEKRRAGTGI